MQWRARLYASATVSKLADEVTYPPESLFIVAVAEKSSSVAVLTSVSAITGSHVPAPAAHQYIRSGKAATGRTAVHSSASSPYAHPSPRRSGPLSAGGIFQSLGASVPLPIQPWQVIQRQAVALHTTLKVPCHRRLLFRQVNERLSFPGNRRAAPSLCAGRLVMRRVTVFIRKTPLTS